MSIKLSNTHICSFFLCLFLLAICVISFGTKGMMLKQTPDISLSEILQPEVYRSLEGLICIDAIFAFYCLLFMVLFCGLRHDIITIFQIFLVFVLIGRFILGVTFLAGDDNFCKERVKEYDDLSSTERGNLSFDQRNLYITTKSAWVFEIIAICTTNILSVFLLLAQNKIKSMKGQKYEAVSEPSARADDITIKGCIKDGATGKPIQDLSLVGLVVKFTSKKNKVYNATINGGVYTVSLPKGDYTITTKLAGFSSSSQSVSLQASCDETNQANTILLVESVDGWRVVLTWNNKAKDLDAYILLPDKKTKIYYSSKSSSDGKVVLDIDNRSGYGPETITLKNIDDGIYAYWVNNYSKECPISETEAKVRVYHKDSQVGEYLVPQNSGNLMNWHVFDINGATDSHVDVNTFAESIS